MGVVNSAGGSLDTCVDHEVFKQEFTTADGPQFNGVAERALGLIETAAMAGRIQAREVFLERNCRQLGRCGLKRRTGRAML